MLTIPSLFENCLSPQPPLTPVYFAAALVLHRGAEVTRCEPDMAMVHHLLSKIPDELVSITSFFYVELLIPRSFLPFQPFEALLKETQRLYLEFPPSTLEKDVKERYRRYREQMKPPSKPRPPKKVRDTSVKVAQLELSFILQGSFFQRDWHRGHSARRGGSGRRHRRVPLAERELYAGGSSNGVSPRLHFSAVPTYNMDIL